MAGIVAATGNMTLFDLLFPYLQTFLAPETIHPLEIYKPVTFPQLDRDPAITISGVLQIQFQHVIEQHPVFFHSDRLIPLCAAVLAKGLAGLTL